MKNIESIQEMPVQEEFSKEIIDNLLELHRQLILLEQLDGGSKIPFLRKIVILRDYFWDLDIEEYLYDHEDLGYIYDKLKRLMEEIKIYVPFPKRTS